MPRGPAGEGGTGPREGSRGHISEPLCDGRFRTRGGERQDQPQGAGAFCTQPGGGSGWAEVQRPPPTGGVNRSSAAFLPDTLHGIFNAGVRACGSLVTCFSFLLSMAKKKVSGSMRAKDKITKPNEPVFTAVLWATSSVFSFSFVREVLFIFASCVKI